MDGEQHTKTTNIGNLARSGREKDPELGDDDELPNKPAHAVPLASARQHPENQKGNQAGRSPERAVEG